MRDYTVDRDSDGLTASERTIVEYLEAGHRQSWIARRLGISRQRVSRKVKALFERGVLAERTCDRCHGTGEVWDGPTPHQCKRCHGRGTKIGRIK